MEKSILEHLLSTSKWWTGFFAVAVVVASFAQSLITIVFDQETQRNKAKTLTSVSLVVIVLAAAFGNCLWDAKVSRISELLRHLADADVARANAKAAEANLKAVRAEAEVARANANAAQARKQSAISLLKAKTAEEEASTNKLEAARLTKIAEDERIARLRLELTTTSRRLSPPDQTVMAYDLKSLAGLQVVIFYRDQDTEPFLFAIDIRQMLLQAHCFPTAPEPEATIISDGAPPPPFLLRTGVWLTYSTVHSTFLAAQAIARTLATMGFEIHLEMASPLSQYRDAPFLTISVEPRPVGVQGRIAASQLSEVVQGQSF